MKKSLSIVLLVTCFVWSLAVAGNENAPERRTSSKERTSQLTSQAGDLQRGHVVQGTHSENKQNQERNREQGTPGSGGHRDSGAGSGGHVGGDHGSGGQGGGDHGGGHGSGGSGGGDHGGGGQGGGGSGGGHGGHK